jgi:hypothetical protein
MRAIDLVAMFDGIKETGPNKWVARCPAHSDRTPSLSIARADDRWLIHCFGGCYPIDVVRAVGLELADLFDNKQYRPRGDRDKPRLSARDALAALDHEIRVAAIICADFLAHKAIDGHDWQRLATASARIGSARALICPEFRR